MPTFCQRFFRTLAALLTLFVAFPASAQDTGTSHTNPATAYGKIPLHFEPNVGQADPAVKFVARGPGYRILLEPAAATIQLHHATAKPARPGKVISEQVETVRLTMAGASTGASIAAQQPSSAYVNYMNGPNHKDWRLGVPTSLQAHTTSLYPGIDVVYYGNQRALEYDFVVAPGADAAKIRMAVSGAAPTVASDGSLLLRTKTSTAGNELRFVKPVMYQEVNGEHVAVTGSFVVASDGEVGFEVGKYDHSRELVIDPLISYAGYFGGTGEDEINASALNASGQLYAVGQTYSTALPGTANEFQTGRLANKNGHAAFVTKFSADGSSILWTTYLEGNGDDFAEGVAVGAADQPYIVGYTSSCGDGATSYAGTGEFPFVNGGAQQLCNPGVDGFNAYESNTNGYDAFVVKLSSDGKSELAGTPLGGSQTDVASSVALDANGKVYVVGQTISTMYTQTSNPNGSGDVPSYPINQHNQAGIGLANFPTTNSAFYTNITESKNNATTCSASTPCPGLPNGSVTGPQDEQAFLTVLSPDLSTIVYSSLLGGPVLGSAGNGTSATNGIAVAVNTNGIAYIGGNTSSAHWPVTAGAIASSCANAGAANSTCNLTGWLAAFDATKSGNASLLFNTYVNGQSAGTNINGATNYPASDVFGLTTDSSGNVVAAGDTNAVDFPTTSGTLQPSCFKFNDGNGNTNVCEFEPFILKASAAGALQWSTFLGATQQDITPGAGRGVAVDSSNNVYLLASTGSAYMPTKNSLVSPVGGLDYYIAELNPTASALILGTYIGIGGGFTPNNNSFAIDSNATVYFSGSQGPNPYGGTYLPVTSSAADQTIQGEDGFVIKLITQQQPSATALTVSPSGTVTPSQTVTLTATVTTSSSLAGTRLPTGTVTFYNNGSTVIGTAALNASGVATFTGMLATGSYSITANYPGDVAFNPSVSTSSALTVSSSVVTATTLTVTPPTATYGTAETMTATVKSGTLSATAGTVTFGAGSLTFGTATINSAGVATLSTTPPVGTYTVVATYAGTYNQTTNPNGYGPSTSNGVSLLITKSASSTLLISSALQAGTAVSFTLSATVPAAATGTVTFYNGTTILGTGTVSNGLVTLSTSIASAGSYSLTATYSGDTNYTGSTSAAVTQIVAVPGFAVTASPSSLTIPRGSTGTTTLTLTPSGGFTGTVTLSCGALPSNATCSFNPSTVTLGASAATDTLTIGTGSLSALSTAPHFFNDYGRGGIYSAGLLGLPAYILVLLGLSRRRKLLPTALRASLVAALCMAPLGLLSGCGGSSSASTAGSNATPAGTYTVSVSLTVGTTTQIVPLTVIVQ